MKPTRPPFSIILLHPRYWLLWLLMGIIWLLVQVLPYRLLMVLGKGVGEALKLIGKKRIRYARINISRCFPDLSQEQQQKLLQENITATGQSLLETCIAWWMPAWRLRKLCKHDGIEVFQEALRDERPLIVVSLHFLNIDLNSQFVNLVAPRLDPLTRPSDNPVVRYLQLRGRTRFGNRTVNKDNIRGAFQTLRSDHALGYAPDQNYFDSNHVFSPFFGHLAATVTGTSILARKTRARCILCYCLKNEDGGYTNFYRPFAFQFPGESIQADTDNVNRMIEETVKLAPSQYVWMHRRFKTRPSGDPEDFYASSGELLAGDGAESQI